MTKNAEEKLRGREEKSTLAEPLLGQGQEREESLKKTQTKTKPNQINQPKISESDLRVSTATGPSTAPTAAFLPPFIPG